jgi:F-type H+-transporting ATPase subunit b
MLDFSVTFIITIINITILFLALRVVLFKPVTKLMAKRAKLIQDSIDKSNKDKIQANALLVQYTNQLKTAEEEAQNILQSAREQAREEAERIIAESRAQAQIIVTNVKKQLEAEHQAAIAVFRQEAASLVVEAAGRLLEREIKSDDCLSYADVLLEEVSHLKDVSFVTGTSFQNENNKT